MTNGSLLFREEVLARVLDADVVVPSLDAPDEAVFQVVNRPHPALSFKTLTEGLMALGRCKGPRVWLEVLLVAGMNDAAEQIQQIGYWIERINPEKVQLNTVVRPPVEDLARPVSEERLRQIEQVLGPRAEIISRPAAGRNQGASKLLESKILDLISRRPCTVEDIADSLGVSREKTSSLLQGMLRDQKIRSEWFDQQHFFRSRQ